MNEARAEAERTGKDKNQSTCEAALQVFSIAAAGYAEIMQDTEGYSDKIREAAATIVGGWAATQINPEHERHKRLRKALTEESHDLPGARRTALYKKLLQEALLAFAALKPEEGLRPGGSSRRSFVSRIEDQVVKEGREAVDKPVSVADESLDFEAAKEEEHPFTRREVIENNLAGRGKPLDQELVEFEAQEAAREQFNARINEWGLTERETEIATLKWVEDMKNSEIANELDIAESTVRVHVNNIEQKARHAEAS